MIPGWRTRFLRFAPPGRLDPFLTGAGALAGLLLVTITTAWLGAYATLPVLIAPMGALAVLLFAFPASPLARPWAVLGGNIISALVGIACIKFFPHPILAAPLSVGLAIIAMRLCRCLHPPGGAVALTVAIGGPTVADLGWSFALMPVGFDAFILLLAAWVFNNATGHRYPHRVEPAPKPLHETPDTAPLDRVGYTMADIDAVLATYDGLLDVSREDLDALFRKVETRAHRRLHRAIRCEDIMSREIISVGPDEGVGQARDKMLLKRLGAMPVVDDQSKLVGLVEHAQLLAGAGKAVRDVMRTDPHLTKPDMPIDELLPALSGGRHHEAMVVSENGQLLGMITQTDLLAALWRSHVAEQVASSDTKAR